MSKQNQLDKIAERIIADEVCPKLAESATQLVLGEGNPSAEVMFIGEAPGAKEDAQGRPFVGSAGQILTELIESLGWQRQDVYITNIVKYRPPNNRDPKPAEKKAFMPYLWQQIAVIRPKLIATLGRHSMEVFLPNKYKISKIHGQPKRVTVNSAQWSVNSKQQANDRETPAAGGQGADNMQGDGEQQTQAYEEYAGGAAQPSTQQIAAENGGVSSFAREQAVRSLVILPLYHTAVALYNANMKETLEADFQKIPQVIAKIKSSEEIEQAQEVKQANLDL